MTEPPQGIPDTTHEKAESPPLIKTKKKPDLMELNILVLKRI
jgi:hypothetical protein